MKIFEDGGMFITPGPPGPGQKHPLRNVDINLHQFGSGGTAPAIGPGLFAGTGPAMGNLRPAQQRMKKMKKS